MKKMRRLAGKVAALCWLEVALLLLTGGLGMVLSANAQTGDMSWSRPELLFMANGRLGGSGQALVADSENRLHAFWIDYPSQEDRGSVSQAVFYSMWDGERWTPPRDVIVLPLDALAEPRPGVTIDSHGMLYLVVGYGPATYARVPVNQAGDPKAWRVVYDVPVRDRIWEAAIQADGQGVLHLAWADFQQRDVFYVQSTDGGTTWSEPRRVSQLDQMRESADSLAMAVTPGGQVHLVWMQNQAPNWYPPQGIFYARSTDRGDTWSTPVQLGDESYANPDILAVNDQEIHIVMGSAQTISKRQYLWSQDGGNTWNEPFIIDSKTGLGNREQIVIDAAGHLHWRVHEEAPVGGSRLLSWDGTRWSQPEVIMVDLAAGPSPISGGTIALAAGNQLHMLFLDSSPGLDVSNLLYHTWRMVDAPAVMPRPMPIVTETPAVVPFGSMAARATPSPTPSPRPTPQTQPMSTPESSQSSQASLLLFGILPSALIVAVVVIFGQARRRR